MMSRVTFLLLTGAIITCYGQCRHEHLNWRNPHRLRWTIEAPWKSSFHTIFDDDWFSIRPYHQIFHTFHDGITHQPSADHMVEAVGRMPQKCSGQRQPVDRPSPEELKWRSGGSILDREEATPMREEEVTSQYTLDREEENVKSSAPASANPEKASIPAKKPTQQAEERNRKTSEPQHRPSQHRWKNDDLETEKGRFREAQRQKEQASKRLHTERDQNRRPSHADTRSSYVEIVRHKAEGYYPDDITVSISDGRVTVHGKHICHCTENCIGKEFTRSYVLPAGVSIQSITATLDKEGVLMVQGTRSQGRGVEKPAHPVKVNVQGVGIPQSTPISQEELKRCLSTKGGIKLSKINKRTGKVQTDNYQYDHEVSRQTSIDKDDFDEATVEIEY